MVQCVFVSVQHARSKREFWLCSKAYVGSIKRLEPRAVATEVNDRTDPHDHSERAEPWRLPELRRAGIPQRGILVRALLHDVDGEPRRRSWRRAQGAALPTACENVGREHLASRYFGRV